MVYKSTIIQQFRLLIWKNYILKLRRPIATLMEILIPLGIVVILMLIRNLQLKFNMDQCYFRDKQMDSMGPLPFLRDFLCAHNNTCYNKTQINWNDTDSNEFHEFLVNITSVYQSFPKDNITIENILKWFDNNAIEVEKLNDSFHYILTKTAPLLRDIELIRSRNKSSVNEGVTGLSSFMCGSPENDLSKFTKAFTRNVTRVTRDVRTCKDSVYQAVGYQIYEVIAPILFGKIYYAPDNKLTREIVRRANTTFVILDQLRLASLEWRTSFREWLAQEMLNGSEIEHLRELAKFCKYTPVPMLANICRVVDELLAPDKVEVAIASLSVMFRFIEDALQCLELNKFVGRASAADIDQLPTEKLIDTFAGLVFDDSLNNVTRYNASLLRYTIRVATSRIDSTKGYKVLDRFWTPQPRREPLQDLKYYTSGFLILQEAIDRAFVDLVANGQRINNIDHADPTDPVDRSDQEDRSDHVDRSDQEDHDPIDIGSSMQIMPSPCYVDDRFIRFAANLMPFLLVMAWSPTFCLLVKSIVFEKERRLKEFMLVMGLTKFAHWLAWFTVAIVTTLIPNMLMTIILSYKQIFEFSSPGVIFVLLFSYTVSFITQACMLSVLFNKANSAAVASGFIYFVFYIPFVVLINVQDDVTYAVYFVTGILSQVSFCNAINFIAFWEQAKVGSQFSNLFQSTVLNLNFGVGHCVVMLWIDTVLYLLVTWYVEAVFPGKYGVPESCFFFLSKRYWWPNKARSIDGYSQPCDTDDVGDFDDAFETVSGNLKVGISIRNLTKTFQENGVVAVDNLNLDFYQSHITAFLGHNGAGKTTTISILTGIFSPTSGTAFIMNQDIRCDIASIRSMIGLCPQHNILFDNLTVADHIYFYGMLKGMSRHSVELALPTILGDVGLTKKVNIQSKKLSGGMKRKLSVAMAFIGNASIIFLDEPTAGVDPFARRGIWDLLIKYRGAEKTIILTTHHMDEADYLSDRIAIISQGKLQCCGSSVFLKKQYGNGYYLILVKSVEAQTEDFIDNEHSASGKSMFRFIRTHIPTAKFVEETRTQWTVILPLDGIKNNGFSNLFQSLDAALASLKISSYGLSDTSLEEVFLKVANDPSKLFNAEENNNNIPSVRRLSSITIDNDLPQMTPLINVSNKLDPDLTTTACDAVECPANDRLLTGFGLLYQQIIALEIKRFHYTKRNWKGLISEIILPVLMIVLIVSLLKMINPFENQPAMIIHPWLMMPTARGNDLNTFYRQENSSNRRIKALTDLYRSDLGESGVRCMNRSVYSLKDLQCYATTGHEWSAAPHGRIPLQSPACDCQKAGYQVCSNPGSGGPPNSHRVMASSDVLNNLTGYNISDNLIKKFASYAQKQYGGYQFLLPNYFGISCKLIANSTLWNSLRQFMNGSDQNNNNSQTINFVNYFQRFFYLSGIRTNFTRIWVNTKGYVSMPAYANIFDNLLLRAKVKSPEKRKNYGIVVSTHPFKYTNEDLKDIISRQMFLEVSLSNFVILALSMVPASFVLFLIEERVSGSKRQQFVSGINPYTYWISNFFWDIIKYALSALLIVVVFFAYNYQSYIGPKNVGAFVAILCCYGFAIIPHMYPFSFIISTPSTAFVVLSAYNMFVGSITTTTTFFLDQLQYGEPNLIPINDALKRLFLVFPQYGLGRGMMDMTLKYMQYNISNGNNDYDSFEWDIAGKKLVSFCLLFIFWSGVIFLIESGLIHRKLFSKIKNYKLKKTEILYDEDRDVAMERERVKTDIRGDDVLKVVDLTKIYNPTLKCSCKCCSKTLTKTLDSEKRKLAVNNICFGVKAGECFGLLGVNGAGKTTTFKMLTGEELITTGDATINGKSINDNMVAAHKDMGFCPQFDALHSLLTCEEELVFYCRIRGIHPSSIKLTVDSSLSSLSLTAHAVKTTHTLSGGNKRKLSTAISLIGNPNIIFMDEPTSGMDAGARRFLWNRIQQLTNQRKAVVLTSHNMEECEVLCHRLAIMVNGELQCLGSVQQLKSKFGDDYYITLRMKSNCDDNGDRDEIKTIMAKKFQSGIFLKDENFVTLQYRIDPSTYKLYTIFEFFEDLKSTGIILDYSVSQTTLDEIFINFAKKEDVSKILSATLVKNVSIFNRKSYVNDSFEDAEVQVVLA